MDIDEQGHRSPPAESNGLSPSKSDSRFSDCQTDSGPVSLPPLKEQTKGPLQLDLFEPRDHEFEYKVIVTNRPQKARAILAFHNGRGSQEQIFAEGKQFAGLGAVATRRKLGNQLVTLAGILAHNLGREVQMCAAPPTRSTMPKRPARWAFMHLGTLQRRLIACAGTLSRPQGRLSLTLGASEQVRDKIVSLTEAARRPSARRAACA